jgi:hypothetical protein
MLLYELALSALAGSVKKNALHLHHSAHRTFQPLALRTFLVSGRDATASIRAI